MEQTVTAQQAAESAYSELRDAHRAVVDDMEAVVRDNQACAAPWAGMHKCVTSSWMSRPCSGKPCRRCDERISGSQIATLTTDFVFFWQLHIVTS